MIPVLVIRHAATDWNEAGLIQGRADRPLSPSGQAEARSWVLPPGWPAARGLASPLRRARETAQILGLRAETETRLVEMDWGEWEGRRLADLRAEFGADMAQNEASGLDFRPPGGESPRDVQARLRPLLAGLQCATILVTHKGVLRALYALASGWTMTGKSAHKLLAGHAHAFAADPDGGARVVELNIPLRQAG